MVTSSVLLRTYRIRLGSSLGTAFAIERNNSQYLITVKHIFKDYGFPTSCNIELLLEGKYQSLSAKVMYHSDPNIDAVAIAYDTTEFKPAYVANDDTTNGLSLGQDVYFLGFPYEYESVLVNLPNTKTPVPFVKKACLSGFSDLDGTLLLDGINNPGFSGGPVCFREKGEKAFKIAGVVNSYRFNKNLLFDERDNEMKYYVRENTGIINACPIEKVYSIIDTQKAEK